MLVLAGVSINAIIGDNGVITNAQRAKLLNGMAILEEYLNTEYVGNFEEMNEAENKIEQLQKIHQEFFYIPAKEGIGILNYLVDGEGHALYLIKKAGLPEEIRNELVGGDAGGLSGASAYTNYLDMNDVYGVTTNLKVYYSSQNAKELFGITMSELDMDNPHREVLSSTSSSSLYRLIERYDKPDDQGEKDGVITSEEIKSVKSLEIKSGDGIDSLADLYVFSNLNELTLDGVDGLSDFTGIEKVNRLKKLTIKNYNTATGATITNCLGISDLKYLEYLHLENVTDAVVSSVFAAMNNTDYSKLEDLKIINSYGNVTTIAVLANLTSDTKRAVKNIYISNNLLVDISALQGFSSVERLECNNNQITSLTPACSNMSNIEYLITNDNDLQDDVENNLYALDAFLR